MTALRPPSGDFTFVYKRSLITPHKVLLTDMVYVPPVGTPPRSIVGTKRDKRKRPFTSRGQRTGRFAPPPSTIMLSAITEEEAEGKDADEDGNMATHRSFGWPRMTSAYRPLTYTPTMMHRLKRLKFDVRPPPPDRGERLREADWQADVEEVRTSLKECIKYGIISDRIAERLSRDSAEGPFNWPPAVLASSFDAVIADQLCLLHRAVVNSSQITSHHGMHLRVKIGSFDVVDKVHHKALGFADGSFNTATALRFVLLFVYAQDTETTQTIRKLRDRGRQWTIYWMARRSDAGKPWHWTACPRNLIPPISPEEHETLMLTPWSQL